MAGQRVPGAITKLAFAEDALAIASWAEAQGFPEDAQLMRDFAQKLLASIPTSMRWTREVAA